MKASLTVTGVAVTGVLLEKVEVNVEYSTDELLALLKIYPELITFVVNLTKGDSHGC